ARLMTNADIKATIAMEREKAAKLAEKIGCTTIAKSGWHVYNNMEHLLGQMTVTSEKCPFTCPYYKGPEINYYKGMLPQTDDLLERAINISIGVSDTGLGSAYGIRITSSKEEIEQVGENLVKAIKECL
ncbi:MAG: hypothetical protein ACFFAO_18615, partial [Candidatus Hermodarchaeota archaeon]